MTSPILVAENVSKVFKMGNVDVPALNGVSLEFSAGESIALTGPSGSGKSTLLNVFSGLAHVTQGRIMVDNRDLAEFSLQARSAFLAQTCGYIFQTFNLIEVLSAVENVELPLWQLSMSRAAVRKKAEEMLERVGLGDRLDHRPGQLSGGQQQRVAIARAIVRRPKILFADEPTANLDAQSSDQIMELIQDLNKTEQCLCLISTHDPDIVRYTQRQVRLRDGKVTS